MSLSINPERSPAYPPPPWTHRGAKTLHVFCRTSNVDALDSWVPSPLQRRGDGIFALVFMELPSIAEIGDQYVSRESGVVIPVIHEESSRIGSTWAIMFVDNDIAQVAGREIWGHPKKLASIELELTTDYARGRVRSLPYRDEYQRVIYETEAQLDGSNENVRDLVSDLGGRIQKRVIPSPFSDAPGHIDVVRIIVSDAKIQFERTGRATVDLMRGREPLDELNPIDVLGAHFRVADFVLQLGKPAMPDARRGRLGQGPAYSETVAGAQ